MPTETRPARPWTFVPGLYVLQGMRGQPGPITDVFRGVIPFMVVYVLAIVILMAVPELALWLPRVSQ